jgi:heme-degrading monooxygenase HmoA
VDALANEKPVKHGMWLSSHTRQRSGDHGACAFRSPPLTACPEEGSLSVLEVAQLSIKDGSGAAFESAFSEAKLLIESASGHVASSLTQSTATGEYVLLVWWRTLEDHVEKFVSSPDFAKFQNLIGEYLAGEPTVKHFQEI